MDSDTSDTVRLVLVLAVVAALAWWILRHQGADKRPLVQMESNATPAPPAPPGIPPNLPEKLAIAVDTQIPVVMTSGSPVQYGEDEIAQIVRSVLARINHMDEQLTLIQVASASKTTDSYKTVSYDIRASVHDSRDNISMLLDMAVLIPVNGSLYIRKLRLAQDAADPTKGPAGFEPAGGLAAYDDPVAVLGKMKVP